MIHSLAPRPSRKLLGNPQIWGSLCLVGISLSLSACGGMPQNRLLESVHQAEVSHQTFALDLTTSPSGLSVDEAHRLDGWLAAMNLRYGDRVAIEDPATSAETRHAIASIVGRYGLLLAESAPVTPGYVSPGSVRVVLTRASAVVPHCPDWDDKSETNFNNATSHNYGCAVNSNMAAMIANPDDLVHGANSTSNTMTQTSDKAVAALRNAPPTGNGNVVKATSSKGS